MPPVTLRPATAAHLDSIARRHMRAKRLTHHAYAVWVTLLWTLRPRGADRVAASYSGMQTVANVCRATVADALDQLEGLGLLTRIKRKTLEGWANGGRKWRQRPSVYVFRCESTTQPEYPKEVILITSPAPDGAAVSTAHAALAVRRRQIEARLLGKHAGRGLLPTPAS